MQSSTPPYISHRRAKDITLKGMTNFPSGPQESLVIAWTLASCVLVGPEGAVFMFYLVAPGGKCFSRWSDGSRGLRRLGREAERGESERRGEEKYK